LNAMALLRNPSQEQKIFEVLRSRGSAWTGAPELSQISLQYCRAISCLRKRGIAIENRVDVVDGVRHGYYRLVQPALRITDRNASSVTAPLLTPSNPQPEPGLFSAAELSRSRKWEDYG